LARVGETVGAIRRQFTISTNPAGQRRSETMPFRRWGRARQQVAVPMPRRPPLVAEEIREEAGARPRPDLPLPSITATLSRAQSHLERDVPKPPVLARVVALLRRFRSTLPEAAVEALDVIATTRSPSSVAFGTPEPRTRTPAGVRRRASRRIRESRARCDPWGTRRLPCSGTAAPPRLRFALDRALRETSIRGQEDQPSHPSRGIRSDQQHTPPMRRLALDVRPRHYKRTSDKSSQISLLHTVQQPKV
jgi:hypothetical protein